jgi:aldose 1-epimerase
MSIHKISILGKDALCLTTERYEAVMIPDFGCNTVSLYDRKKQLQILKTPSDSDRDEFFKAPQHFGNAVLFPPNRIEHGYYKKNGITYSFIPKGLSLDEAKNYMYSHGILRFMEFHVDELTEADGKIVLKASYTSAPGGEIFRSFPHEFCCRMTFVLSNLGLTQHISFHNKSTLPMPVGVGFHTAFRLPNDDTSTRSDYRILLSAGEHIELDERCLPTGKRTPLLSACRDEGIPPFEPIADEHTTALPLILNQKSFHGAIIKNIRTNNNIYFETSESFGYWMLWNNQARSDYVCIEPMSWIINAPNSPLEDSLTGYTQLAPDEIWNGSLRIFS